MKLEEFEKLFNETIAKLALRDKKLIEFKFVWMRRGCFSQYGVCVFNRKTGEKKIKFNPDFIENETQEWIVKDLLLHEIAHAIDLCRYGSVKKPHGPRWRLICKEIGAIPKATMHDEAIDLKELALKNKKAWTLRHKETMVVYHSSNRYSKRFSLAAENGLGIVEKPETKGFLEYVKI